MSIAVLIPAYQPDQRLSTLVEGLLAEKFDVLVVDDGSSSQCQPVFENLENELKCMVIHHPVNLGKGSALKTGMKQLLSQPEISGCVTADADGQHLIEDIRRVADTLKQYPQEMILGSRNFDNSNVPLKSMLGNKITRTITRLLIGQKISDTQTGLRGFSRQAMEALIDLPGDRYEFEMNMLLYSKKLKIPIREVKIHTVYLDDNKGSHFDPVKDSIKIYKQIFGFAITSSLSAIIDLGLFRVLYQVFWILQIKEAVLLSTVIARAFSSVFNFSVNKKTVFQNDGNLKNQLIGYYILALFIMLSSWGLVEFFNQMLMIDIAWIKLAVDSILFMLSFSVQKHWIFRKK